MKQLSLSNERFVRGILYIIGGCALLLYTLDLITSGINFILTISSLVMIAYGIRQASLIEHIRNFLKRNKKVVAPVTKAIATRKKKPAQGKKTKGSS